MEAGYAAAVDTGTAFFGTDEVYTGSLRGVVPWMNVMADAVVLLEIRAEGVSNCSAAQMRTAATVLARYDIRLAANQVQYSLLHRKPEHDGVLRACRQHDVVLIAYRPIRGGAMRSSSVEAGAGGTEGDAAGGGPTEAALLRVLGEVAAGATSAWLPYPALPRSPM